MLRFAKAAAVAAAAGAVVAGGAGVASADASATGAAIGSPGFLSGNLLQLPESYPLNYCGNTTNGAAALLNPTFGNQCQNISVAEHGNW
jgi:hypothetical protein